MQIQNKKTVQKFSMLSCLLALVLLLTGLSVSGIFNTKAEETDNTYYKITTNFSDIYLNCTRILVSQFYRYTVIPPEISSGYELVIVENINPEHDPVSTIQKNSDGFYYFHIPGPLNISPETVAIGVLKKVIGFPETPTKEGYTFTQWYLDEACTTPYDGREITEDLTLYAGWKINTFTITFDSAGGTAVSTVSAEYNTTITLTTPTREGYNFVGWYNGSTKYNGEPIKDNMTLVAKWQIKVYTVTFMVDGETYKTLEVNHGTSLSSVMSKADLKYYIPYDSQGVRMSVNEKITGNTALSVAEMTGEEKVAQFLAANSWILWLSGALIVMLTLSLIFSVKKGKR